MEHRVIQVPGSLLLNRDQTALGRRFPLGAFRKAPARHWSETNKKPVTAAVSTAAVAVAVAPIAVATPTRDPVYRDVPTLIEQGFNFSTWDSMKGIAVAKATPPEVIAYYEEVFKKISQDEEFKKTMADLGQPILYMNAKEYAELMKTVYDYGKLIKDLNITIQ